jgi:outer membrane protein assembly factor BamB
MIRIRTGASWRDDPRVTSLVRASPPAARAAAREITDALAIEIDGIDIAAGRAEAPLLPSLEALLRAISRVIGGAPQAAVVLGEGGLELVVRRRGASALLTVVALGRPSRLLARDVEVEIEALAAAALEAAADFCRDLAAAVPALARDAGPLQAAARDLSRARPRAERAPPPPAVRSAAPEPGRFGCAVELTDHDGLLAAYEGGRPDLGSLLVPGRLALHGADDALLLAIDGHPFLALRDLVAAADRVLCAARRRESRAQIPLARGGRGTSTFSLDLAAGTTALDGRPVACPPLSLLRAFAECAQDFCRLVRDQNPRQAENAHLSELEAAAAARIAELDELAASDVPGAEAAQGIARARPEARPDPRPLGPGRLRRLSFRKVLTLEVGEPSALALRAGRLLAGGRHELVLVDLATGAVAWRAPGAAIVELATGAILAASGDRVRALHPATGRGRWTARPSAGAITGLAAMAGGPVALVEAGAITALDPKTGEVAWRFGAPGAGRTWATGFGGVLVVGSDTGFLYGLDAAGRLRWRVRAPGPLRRAPMARGGVCLALCEAAPGISLLALDAATGLRRFEAPLELTPVGPPEPWGRRLAVAGTVAGDPAVTVLDDDGAPAWTSAPPLDGALHVRAAGRLLLLRDDQGALAALDRRGRPAWSRPAPDGAGRGARPLALARETLVVGGDGVALHAVATGELLGALPGVSAARLVVDDQLTMAALDLDGLLTVHRLGTHLSVV